MEIGSKEHFKQLKKVSSFANKEIKKGSKSKALEGKKKHRIGDSKKEDKSGELKPYRYN